MHRFADCLDDAVIRIKRIKTYPEGVGCKCEDLLYSSRPQPNMEKAAAFLETRRYGAILGGTTEWSKLEGALRSCMPDMW